MVDGRSADTTSFAFESIELEGGWSVRLLTAWPAGCGVAGGSTGLTSDAVVSEWREALTTLVTRVESLPGCLVLKHSQTAQTYVALVDLEGGSLEVVCKHAAGRGFLQRVVRRVRGSREARNWGRGLTLLDAGINTAMPRALLERGGRDPEAWLVTESIPDSIDLECLLSWQVYDMDPARFVRLKRALVRSLVEMCVRMERAEVCHRDFKGSNVLVTGWQGESGTPKLWLVDLDGIRRGAARQTGRRWRGIMRLAASLVNHPSVTRTDCARFLRAYLSSGRSRTANWRNRWRRLAAAVECYNRRSRLRKRGKLDGFD